MKETELDLLEEQTQIRSAIDGFVEKNGLEESDVYKKLKESRTEGKTSSDECEQLISERYGIEREKRDDALLLMSSSYLIEKLKNLNGSLTNENIVDLIKNGIEIEEDGTVKIDPRFGIDITKLPENERQGLEDGLYKASHRNLRISQISESDKSAVREFLDVKDGKYVCQIEDWSDVPKGVEYILKSMIGKECNEEQYNNYSTSSQQIEFLAACEVELINGHSVEIAQQAHGALAREGRALREAGPKGFWGTLGQVKKTFDLRRQAKNIIAAREEKFISDSISIASGKNTSLMSYAQEKLMEAREGLNEMGRKPTELEPEI